MQKKILFFIGASYVSGLEVVTLHLIKGLVKNGYEVECVISGWNDGNFKDKLDAAGVRYHQIKLGWIYFKKPLWTVDTLLHYPRAYRAVKKIIRDFNPDIFHFCNYGMLLMLYPLINRNTVYNLQETHEPSLKHRIIYTLLNKKVSCFTAVSRHIVNVLERLAIPSKKIRLIYNGIPPIKEVSITDNQSPLLTFAVIGQVVEWKGHGILLEAVELLVKKGMTSFKVQIFGNDKTEYGDQLKLTIEKYDLTAFFEWKGFVNDQEQVYKDCSIVIVPSLSGEPCSLTIIESMWRSKALIVSDRGGNPELIEHGVTGLVSKAADTQALCEAMYLLINQRNKISTLADNARKKAQNNYSSERMTSMYMEEVYGERIKN
jgi:glycosyltransferase involved in cell wall biosynthesis